MLYKYKNNVKLLPPSKNLISARKYKGQRSFFYSDIYSNEQEICYKSQMKIRKSKTIDFSSIFKGYRIPIPFFLLCIGINNIEKLKIKNKQKNCKHLNFTRFLAFLKKKLYFLIWYIMRNNNFNEKHDHLKPLISLAYKHIF